MRKTPLALLCCLLCAAMLLTSCAAETTTAAPAPAVQENTSEPEQEALPEVEPEAEPAPLPDGIYSAIFDTDSSMFRVNETCGGRGILTVENGKMTIHVSLLSKKILNLYPGLADDAIQEGAELLQPTVDTVTYSDGLSEEVYGFDIPVPWLNEEFDCALVGTKGTWYDHKVSVSDAQPLAEPEELSVEVTLSGGSGRASVESPAKVIRNADGSCTATVIWSSPNYEYVLVDGVQYDRLPGDGNSTFEIPVVLDEDMQISALTVAMSEPHLIDYILHFSTEVN